MNKANQIKLDELITQSKTMYTDHDREVFSPKWWRFVNSLDSKDARIAVDAYFAAIFDNLNQIEKDVKDLVQNGTEQDRLEYSALLDTLKEPLMANRNRIAA